MRPIVQEVQTPHSPESLASRLRGEKSVVLLQSALRDASPARYSFVTARPFLTFRSFGSLCETESSHSGAVQQQFGNPWQILDRLMARFELLEEIDMPFPLGGCFGYWGYDLKNFVEPKVSRRAINDLELPDCHVGFYDSLAVFDHQPGRTFIVSTGLDADGSRSESRAKERLEFWACLLEQRPEMRTGQGNAGGAGDAGLNKEQGWGHSQRDLTPPSPTLPPLVPRGEREKKAP
jgi:para-aminobenzoate synthetase component 1